MYKSMRVSRNEVEITDPYFEVGPVWAVLKNPTKELENSLSACLAFEQENYFFSYRYKRGIWDGKIRFYSRVTQKFLAGLVPVVNEVFGLPVVDVRKVPAFDRSIVELEGITWRDYQKEQVRIAIEKTRGLSWSATGAGKTEVAAGILGTLGVKSLVVVPRVELLLQTKERYEMRLGCEIGTIGAGTWQEEKITIATIQSLSSKSKREKVHELLNSVDCVILDETHLAAADTWSNMMQKCPAYFKFGFSGTALVSDNIRDVKLIGITGPVLFEIHPMELVEQGVLATPTIYFTRYKATEVKGDYASAYQAGIVESKARNSKIVEIAKKYEDKQVLILVTRIQHGQLLQQELASHLIFAPFMSGEEAKDLREMTLTKFRDGELRCLIGSTIYDLGVDLPKLDVLILAGAGKSQVAALQRIGRSLRKTEGKDTTIIFDFWDNSNRYLLNHTKHRKDIYMKYEFPTVDDGMLLKSVLA